MDASAFTLCVYLMLLWCHSRAGAACIPRGKVLSPPWAAPKMKVSLLNELRFLYFPLKGPGGVSRDIAILYTRNLLLGMGLFHGQNLSCVSRPPSTLRNPRAMSWSGRRTSVPFVLHWQRGAGSRAALVLAPGPGVERFRARLFSSLCSQSPSTTPTW